MHEQEEHTKLNIFTLVSKPSHNKNIPT